LSTRRRILLQNTIPTYDTPEDAVKTHLYMVQHRRNLRIALRDPCRTFRGSGACEKPFEGFDPKGHQRGEDDPFMRKNRNGSWSIMGSPGGLIPSQPTDVEEAISIAKYVGTRVVLKIVSPDITYKSDAGGIITGNQLRRNGSS